MPIAFRFETATGGMDASERICTLCKRPLRRKAVWLELDQRTNTYHDSEGVPPSQSQGWFAFGRDCAETLTAAHRREIDRRSIF